MSKEVLTHSEAYVKKTNRIMLVIGITCLSIFLFGLYLLATGGEETKDYTDPIFTDNDDALNIGAVSPLNSDIIQFGDVEDAALPITLTPNPVPLGQVVLGTSADNVLTIGTTGKSTIKIVSVNLAEPPADGFVFNEECTGVTLTGKETCNIVMKWTPVIAGNVQNNFIISWYETNLGEANTKSEKVPVIGNAIRKEDCNFCEGITEGNLTAKDVNKDYEKISMAVGPDGKEIGWVDKEGYVRDKNGNIIGRVNSQGLVVDADGNVVGVASNSQIGIDKNGNVLGYIGSDDIVYDKEGKKIGKKLPDGSIVNDRGEIIGKAVETGYVYDKDGNIIGRVLADGTVVDMDGNVIGRVNENGEVVDLNGNIIGTISKPGRVAVDENGNPIGVVMPDGTIVDANGNIIGRIGENGNVTTSEKLGKPSIQRRLAYDKDGNVIGYID